MKDNIHCNTNQWKRPVILLSSPFRTNEFNDDETSIQSQKDAEYIEHFPINYGHIQTLRIYVNTIHIKNQKILQW